jgi:hypothetical protein
MTQYRMLDDSAPATMNAAAPTLTLGARFLVKQAGTITHLRFWHQGPCNGYDHAPALWSQGSGTKLAEVSVAGHDANLLGYIETPLAVPYPIEPGPYQVTYDLEGGNQGQTDVSPISISPDWLQLDGGSYALAFDTFPTNYIPGHYHADVVLDSGVVIPPEPPVGEGKGLTKARQQLMDALSAADIRTYYGMGVFSAPCARIFPAEPWVEIDGRLNGRRVQSWEVWAVAGQADSLATFDELEAMVMAIDAAIDPLQSWSHPTWRRPAVTAMGGAKYFACRGTIETIAEVH